MKFEYNISVTFLETKMKLMLNVENILKFNPEFSFTDIIKAVKKWDKTAVRNKMGYFGSYHFLELTGTTSLSDYLGIITNVIYNKNNIEMEIKPRYDIDEIIFKDKILRGLFAIQSEKLYLQGVGLTSL